MQPHLSLRKKKANSMESYLPTFSPEKKEINTGNISSMEENAAIILMNSYDSPEEFPAFVHPLTAGIQKRKDGDSKKGKLGIPNDRDPFSICF